MGFSCLGLPRVLGSSLEPGPAAAPRNAHRGWRRVCYAQPTQQPLRPGCRGSGASLLNSRPQGGGAWGTACGGQPGRTSGHLAVSETGLQATVGSRRTPQWAVEPWAALPPFSPGPFTQHAASGDPGHQWGAPFGAWSCPEARRRRPSAQNAGTVQDRGLKRGGPASEQAGPCVCVRELLAACGEARPIPPGAPGRRRPLAVSSQACPLLGQSAVSPLLRPRAPLVTSFNPPHPQEAPSPYAAELQRWGCGSGPCSCASGRLLHGMGCVSPRPVSRPRLLQVPHGVSGAAPPGGAGGRVVLSGVCHPQSCCHRHR